MRRAGPPDRTRLPVRDYFDLCSYEKKTIPARLAGWPHNNACKEAL